MRAYFSHLSGSDDTVLPSESSSLRSLVTCWVTLAKSNGN